jgi:hypothetical protein
MDSVVSSLPPGLPVPPPHGTPGGPLSGLSRDLPALFVSFLIVLYFFVADNSGTVQRDFIFFDIKMWIDVGLNMDHFWF